MPFSAYVICATPRSGSTLLCDLLRQSGAGQPNSYLRSQDISYWARLWGVRGRNTPSDPVFNRAYLAAMIDAGRGPTEIFGLRLMWQSVSEAAERFNAAIRKADLLTQFQQAFGSTLLIHLSRKNMEAQAVSLVRAQQTGLWHVSVDGPERERTAPPQPPVFNEGRLREAYDMLVASDLSWHNFFSQRNILPLQLWYDELAADPREIVADLLFALGHDRSRAANPSPQTAKMADHTSFDWMRQLKKE